ncbi:uncharacterized protein snapc2 [Symphorus nematophorus]
MKPPPRTRKVPRLKREPEPAPAPKSHKWHRVEQMKLLSALKRLAKTTETEDIDYDYLGKSVRSRSISEIQSVVESLKNKVISYASFKYRKKKWQEKKAGKPIEVWTHMASCVTGTLEETITNAFSQMLIVSATEPRTLKNCDPPELHRQPTAERPAGRTVPLRPVARLPVRDEGPRTNTARPHNIFKTPTPSMGPAFKVPQQQLSTTAGTSPAATSTSQSAATSTSQSAATSTSQSTATSCQPVAAEIVVMPVSQTVTSVTGQAPPRCSSAAVAKTPSAGSSAVQNTQQPTGQHPPTITTTSTAQSTPSGPNTPLSTSLTPVPSTAPPSVASSSCSTPTLSKPTAAAAQFRRGCTSKSTTKDSRRLLGVKWVVDFEKIYCYLSAIHKPNDECCLTPMESAIVLDLLMSLPEELPLLDCKKLHKHFTQVYQCLSSPADSRMAKEMFKGLEDGLGVRTEAASSRPDAAGTTDGAKVTDGGGKTVQPDEAQSQSSSNNNTSSQSGDTDMTRLCPPLNPFMVPLKLLMRR